MKHLTRKFKHNIGIIILIALIMILFSIIYCMLPENIKSSFKEPKHLVFLLVALVIGSLIVIIGWEKSYHFRSAIREYRVLVIGTFVFGLFIFGFSYLVMLTQVKQNANNGQQAAISDPNGASDIMIDDNYLLETTGMIFGLFAGLFTMTGFALTISQLKAERNTIKDYEDLLYRCTILVDNIQKKGGKLDFVTYTPIPGNLTLRKQEKEDVAGDFYDKLKRLSDNRSKAKQVRIICLDHKARSDFYDRFVRESGYSEDLVQSALQTDADILHTLQTKPIVCNVIEVSNTCDIPFSYHFLLSDNIAILYFTFYVPPPQIVIQTSEMTFRDVEVYGFETEDKRLISKCQRTFDDLWEKLGGEQVSTGQDSDSDDSTSVEDSDESKENETMQADGENTQKG